MRIDLIDRLWSNTTIKDGHWLWRSVSKNQIYGLINADKKLVRVHRLSVSIYHNKDLSDSSWIACHSCSYPNCWNPLHLYAGTHSSNLEDAVKDGKFTYPKKQGFCKRGHLLSKENTWIRTGKRSGSRDCKECSRLRVKKYWVNRRKKCLQHSSI